MRCDQLCYFALLLQKGVLEQYDVLLQGDLEQSVFLEPLEWMPELVAGEIPDFRKSLLTLIEDEIIPAVTRQRIFIENVSSDQIILNGK